MSSVWVAIGPGQVARTISFLILFFFVADVGAHILRASTDNAQLVKTARLFMLDEEQNFPTYFASLLFLFIAVLSGNIATRLNRGDRDIAYWKGLAVLFVFVSMDEFIMIHEKLGGVLSIFISTSGVWTFNWIILYGILGLIIMALYARFFLRLPAFLQKRLMLAGALFFLGAFVGEMIEGAIYHQTGGQKPPHFYVVASLEEVLELCGALIIIQALLKLSQIRDHGLNNRAAAGNDAPMAGALDNGEAR